MTENDLSPIDKAPMVKLECCLTGEPVLALHRSQDQDPWVEILVPEDEHLPDGICIGLRWSDLQALLR